MADDDRTALLTRLRREPPPLELVEVIERVELSPRLIRITLQGDGIGDLDIDRPAMSVRLLVPTPGTDELVIPEWNGNEFLLPGEHRPALRTFTPLDVDHDAGLLDIEIVRHPGGAVSEWAESVEPGAIAAISGPGSGYDIPDDADRLILLADETALPAARQIASMAPSSVRLELHVEVVSEEAIIDVDVGEDGSVEWHVTDEGQIPGDELADVAEQLTELDDGTYLWAAGEASAMHAIRTHLFGTLGLERKRATVRGYWKPARN